MLLYFLNILKIMAIFDKIKSLFKSKLTVNQPVYAEDGASVICQDKDNGVIKQMSIVPEHINPNLDIPTTFPKFVVNKKTAREGMIGMHFARVLNLDTDEAPIQGSKNLLTSGTLYEILNDLQDQIDDLRFSIEK